MPWGPIRGHDRQVEELRRALEAGRLPHAILLVGPEGVGKRSFARRLGQSLLCERRPPESLDPCGLCPGCLQARAGNHPDLIEAGRPEDKHELPVAVIRGLCDRLALKPARGGRKVAILDDADDLNPEAANAFLKTLEEPPDATTLLLIGTSAELQLETIVSRCRVLRFDRLTEDDLAATLLDQGLTADPGRARELAVEAEGSVARARGLADEAFAHFRRDVFQALVAEGGFDPPALARQIEGFAREAGKESAAQRGRASLLVGEFARLFRGVLYQTAGVEPASGEPEVRRVVEALAGRLEPEDVFLLADRCIEAEAQIARRLSLALILDALCHDLGRRIQGPRQG